MVSAACRRSGSEVASGPPITSAAAGAASRRAGVGLAADAAPAATAGAAGRAGPRRDSAINATPRMTAPHPRITPMGSARVRAGAGAVVAAGGVVAVAAGRGPGGFPTVARAAATLARGTTRPRAAASTSSHDIDGAATAGTGGETAPLAAGVRIAGVAGAGADGATTAEADEAEAEGARAGGAGAGAGAAGGAGGGGMGAGTG